MTCRTRDPLPVTTLAIFAAALLCAVLPWLPCPGPLSATTAAAAQQEHPQPRLNKVIELFEAGKPALGIFSSNPTVRNAVALSASPADFVLVDMEHSPLDFPSLQVFLMAMTDKRRVLEKGNAQPDVVPLVRLPQNGRERLQFLIKQALDVGAYGLMLPHVETAEEALAAVRSARYAQFRGVADFEPTGLRGAAYGYAARVWGISARRYVELADVWPHDPRGEVLLMHQIESKRAVANVDEILSVPGVGAIFIGPTDLALSLGVDSDHPDLEAAIQTVLAAAKAKGVPCGIPASATTVEQRLKQGFRFFTLGGDTGLNPSAAAALDAGRKASGRGH